MSGSAWRNGIWLAMALCTVRLASAQQRADSPAQGVQYSVRTVRVGGGRRTTVHVARVDLCNPAVSLRVSTAEQGRRTVSEFARRAGAAVAINGDYFDRRTLAPLGPTRGAGHWWPAAPREHRDALIATAGAGAVTILDAPDLAHDALWLDAPSRLDERHREVLAVRERVLVAGRVRLSPRIHHEPGRHPRTALGLSADGHTLWMLVADGRSRASAGLTVRELATLLRSLGAREGMKLDGGGSSAMFVAGRGVVNRPSDGTERIVANHLAVMVQPAIPRGASSWCR